jgi:hypothetical protein
MRADPLNENTLAHEIDRGNETISVSQYVENSLVTDNIRTSKVMLHICKARPFSSFAGSIPRSQGALGVRVYSLPEFTKAT